MKNFVVLLFLVFGMFASSFAEAEELTVSRAVLEDVGGKLSISDVATREFRPVGPSLTKGFSGAVYWLRLKVKAPTNGNKVVLFVRQPFLNEIRLYEANGQDTATWKSRVTGSLYPYADRERGTNSLGFVVDMEGDEATFYLRLKTRVWSELTVEALTPKAADQLDKQFDIMAVLFVTAMLLILIWAVQSYFLDRLPVVGFFALHQFAYTWFGVAVTGYLARWIPIGSPLLVDLNTIIPYCAVSITPLLLCRELFKAYDPPPILMRGLNLLLLALPFQIAAIVLDHLPIAALIGAVVIRISWLYFVLITFFLRKEQSPSRRSLQVVFIIFTGLLLAFWIAGISSPSDSRHYLYGRHMLIANGIVIGVLFCLVLNARIRKVFQDAQRATMQLDLTQKTLEIERTLKNEAETQARTDYLTGLSNRRYFVERAELELERSIRYQHALSLMMIDIDYFKAVNDTWGHGIGDLVLQSVAMQIKNALRSTDLCARTGGEEFAAIILGTDEASALEVAQRLCVAVARTPIVPQEGISVSVTVSIGLTTLGSHSTGLDSMMKEVDQLMYRAKELGRNQVVASKQPEAV